MHCLRQIACPHMPPSLAAFLACWQVTPSAMTDALPAIAKLRRVEMSVAPTYWTASYAFRRLSSVISHAFSVEVWSHKRRAISCRLRHRLSDQKSYQLILVTLTWLRLMLCDPALCPERICASAEGIETLHTTEHRQACLCVAETVFNLHSVVSVGLSHSVRSLAKREVLLVYSFRVGGHRWW